MSLSGGLLADGDDEIADGIDDGDGAGIDQDGGVELGHDGRSRDHGTDRQPVAAIDRRLEPCAGKIDGTLALPGVFQAAAWLGREDGEVDPRRRPKLAVRRLERMAVISMSSMSKRSL